MTRKADGAGLHEFQIMNAPKKRLVYSLTLSRPKYAWRQNKRPNLEIDVQNNVGISTTTHGNNSRKPEQYQHVNNTVDNPSVSRMEALTDKPQEDNSFSGDVPRNLRSSILKNPALSTNLPGERLHQELCRTTHYRQTQVTTT
jgi:hypothetical protein